MISNKGGAGKTSVAIALGCYYSMKMGQPTLLLELDSSPGDFGVLFDIEAENSLEMALRFPGNCKKYIKKISENLDILKGIQNPVIAESVKKGQLYNMMDQLGGLYQHIVIDTQSVLNGVVLDALSVSSRILLITDNSIESFNRVLSFNEMLTQSFSIPVDKISLLVNKKRIRDFLKVWDVAKMTGLPVNGFILYDKHFNKSFCMTGIKKIARTGFYKHLSRIIENGFEGKA